MRRTVNWVVAAAVLALGAERWCSPLRACCGVGSDGRPVVNADQTVLMVWNAAAKTQHFIRQANFKTAGQDFGFLVPTPATPELAESGTEAFSHLMKITAPAIERRAIDPENQPKSAEKSSGVRVLSEKMVAGFRATVLEADEGAALAKWLGEHGFEFSPAVAAWADPYVKGKWKFTALRLVKGHAEGNDAAAKALRISFKTDQPIFPYREPESAAAAKELRAYGRLLRLYFVAETQYEGWLGEKPWETPAWSGALTPPQRAELLSLLKLQEGDAPKIAWLTEFEHYWPYQLAAHDVEFRPALNPREIRKPPQIQYYTPTARAWMGGVEFGGAAFGLAVVLGVAAWRWRSNSKSNF